MEGIQTFWKEVLEIQKKVIDTQSEILETVAKEMAKTIRGGGRVFIFGTGHSSMIAMEGHLRAGGLAPVVPIFRTNLMIHENAMLSSKIERTAGLASPILDSYDPQPGDLMFIVSNSGVNQMPVEMCLESQARGLKVVTICAKEYAKVAPLSSIGKRLYDIADYVIDNCGVPGDALVPLKNKPWKVASSSTIAGTLIWECLVAETCLILDADGGEMPVFISANMPGATDHNDALFKEWRTKNPHF